MRDEQDIKIRTQYFADGGYSVSISKYGIRRFVNIDYMDGFLGFQFLCFKYRDHKNQNLYDHSPTNFRRLEDSIRFSVGWVTNSKRT